MKRRLVFLSRDHNELCEIVEMLNQSHLNCWRWRIFTGAAADVQRLGLPLASPLMLSNVLGGAWRGGFWGFCLGVLLAVFALSLFTVDDGVARTIIMYSLPITLLLFGAWEGGFLGLMQDNPAFDDYRPYAENNLFVLLVDVHAVDQRLLKKIMAMCNADQVGEHCRRTWGFPWRENIFNNTEVPAELS
ncbi:hypothetical protein [Zhongshania sp.]|jgi:hypothetical protein|uniref:hypothetical protein n=1 Tax=Zhongshania sp. TaxID=1971902 RepID=UPI0039E66D6A